MEKELTQIYEVVEKELQAVENCLIKEYQLEFPFVSSSISGLLNRGKRLCS